MATPNLFTRASFSARLFDMNASYSGDIARSTKSANRRNAFCSFGDAARNPLSIGCGNPKTDRS